MYVWDARQAAELVIRFTAGRSFDDYTTDAMLRSAVERQLGIMGEAFAAMRRKAPEVAAIIPDLFKIIAFRNVLIHNYANIDDAVVWKAIHDELPGMLAKLADLLDGPDSPFADLL